MATQTISVTLAKEYILKFEAGASNSGSLHPPCRHCACFRHGFRHGMCRRTFCRRSWCEAWGRRRNPRHRKHPPPTGKCHCLVNSRFRSAQAKEPLWTEGQGPAQQHLCALRLSTFSCAPHPPCLLLAPCVHRGLRHRWSAHPVSSSAMQYRCLPLLVSAPQSRNQQPKLRCSSTLSQVEQYASGQSRVVL